MLELDNQTSFQAQVVPLHDGEWNTIVTVIVKGTYDIGPSGGVTLSREQVPIQLADQHAGKEGESSVICESDVAIFKPGTDVILSGTAYAPGGRPLESFDVQLKAGPVAKTLRIFGDRRWENRMIGGAKPTPPIPFVTMPLTYERAFGGKDFSHADPKKQGWEARNPVGAGFCMNPDNVKDLSLPNIESPSELITGWKDKPAPHGFGCIGRSWQPRLRYAGTYDKEWEENRAPCLPADFDYRYFQSAHPDLVATPHLSGTERIDAINVTPSGRLTLALPGDGVTVTAHYANSIKTEKGLLDTVILMPDTGKLLLVWRCRFPVPGSYADLEAIQVFPEHHVRDH